MIFKWVFDFLLSVSLPRFQNNISARLIAIFFGDSWGVELWITLCVLLPQIFYDGKDLSDMWRNVGLKNLITTYWTVNIELYWSMMHVCQYMLFTFCTLFYECSHILWVVFCYFIYILNIILKLGWSANQKVILYLF